MGEWMTGPGIRATRIDRELVDVGDTSVGDAAAQALAHARAIEALLERALASASASDAYRLRLAQAVCSSLASELAPIAEPTSPSSVRTRAASRQ